MKTFFYPLLLFILIIFNSCKQESSVVKTKTLDRNAIVDSTINAFQQKLLKTQIDSVFSKYHFNGSVAIFKDSIQIYRRNQGFADFKTKIPIHDSVNFAIASISKQFTAALILQQVEFGKVKLEDKVSQFVKGFEKSEYKNISIQQLLNHTSGLNLIGQKLMFKSGEDFNYSNDGYNALGEILEIVTGKSFDENATELFQKVGMKNTFTPKTYKGSNFGSAYLGNSKNCAEVPNMPKRLSGGDVGTPAGGILSSIDDLHIWNEKLYSGKVLKPETVDMMTTKSATRMHQIFGKMGYGYGIMLNVGHPKAYFHSGYVKGSPSLNIYYPESKTSVIILSNIADETKVKNAVFLPHKEIKKIMDNTEVLAAELRSELLKTQQEDNFKK